MQKGETVVTSAELAAIYPKMMTGEEILNAEFAARVKEERPRRLAEADAEARRISERHEREHAERKKQTALLGELRAAAPRGSDALRTVEAERARLAERLRRCDALIAGLKTGGIRAFEGES
jgi:seryl-tRNA synthetase